MGAFPLCPLVFPGCWPLHFQVWGLRSKEKTQGTHHRFIPWVLRYLAGLPSALHLSESSIVCFTANVQGFSCTELEE